MAITSSKKSGQKFEFVINLKGSATDRLSSPQQDSANRSHAAKISHARRKEKLERKQFESLGMNYDEVKLRQTKGHETFEHNFLPPLLAGNSDPFSSTAIRITPQINLILTFLRDAVCPALYGTAYYRNCSIDVPSQIDLQRPPTTISCRAAVRAWKQEIRCLFDEGTVLASLSTWCDLLPLFLGVLPPQYQEYKGSQMRGRSVQLLREKLKVNDSGELPKFDHPTFLHIFFLFQACLLAGEYDAAAVHAKIMRSVVEEGFKLGAVDMQMLVHFLYVDVDSAVKNLRHTLFDVDDWMPMALDGLWTLTKTIFPPAQLEETLISVTIEDEVLLSVIFEHRYQLSFHPGRFALKDFDEMGPADMLFASMSSRAFVDLGRLINRYLFLIADHEGNWETRGRRYTQACLILSVLLVMRSYGHTALIQDIDLRDASPVLMAHLKPLISKTLMISTEEELMLYSQAHLWTLYVIVLFEQRVKGSSGLFIRGSSSGFNDTIFDMLLAHQAHREGISTWRAMQRIEALFIQTNLIQPSGETWFEDMITMKKWSTPSPIDSGYASSLSEYHWNSSSPPIFC